MVAKATAKTQPEETILLGTLRALSQSMDNTQRLETTILGDTGTSSVLAGKNIKDTLVGYSLL